MPHTCPVLLGCLLQQICLMLLGLCILSRGDMSTRGFVGLPLGRIGGKESDMVLR
jgi:hypothetical protein